MWGRVNQCVLWGIDVVSGLEEMQGRERSHCDGAEMDQCVLWGLAVDVYRGREWVWCCVLYLHLLTTTTTTTIITVISLLACLSACLLVHLSVL
ncbi:hypothetical protein E2C01_072843 [Portunus trituberculatus]|uniref:Uncharacterized protein n=1 Tax=Portunus trituberculatus TaxID=210409 RepID=A0A5B7I8Z8_PORTR|nr:hypothetical protein [Portunus trituberculatus]